MKCKHCGCVIVQYSEKLYHQVGSLVFPQYCAQPGADKLHEPEHEKRTGITDEMRSRAKARIAAKEFVKLVRVDGYGWAHRIPDALVDTLTDEEFAIFKQYCTEHRIKQRPDWLWETC